MNDERLNFLGEFSDKKLEKEFFDQDMKRAMVYIRPIVLLLGVLNALFIIPDFFLVRSPERITAILISRAIFIVLVVILFFRIRKVKNYRLLSAWFSIYELLAVVVFMFVFFQYENPDFLIQAFGLMIIILAVFMIPNRWVCMISVSIAVLAVFTAFSLSWLHGIEPGHLSAGIVYNAVVIAFGSVSSQRNQRLKRIQYINNRELLRLSSTDSLTGIYNRGKFDEEMKRAKVYSARYRSPLSLIIFDIDNFKDINDTYGHPAGDQVLVEAVRVIRDKIRSADSFARWGGEEFVILLPNTALNAAAELAERLRACVALHDFGKAGTVTCSFGVVERQPGEQSGELIERADRLLYQAKKTGKNRVAS